MAGRRLDFTDEMVEVERGRGGKLVSQDATIPYALSVQCEDADEGTGVTWHQEVESLKGLFKFADPIVMKLYARRLLESVARQLGLAYAARPMSRMTHGCEQ